MSDDFKFGSGDPLKQDHTPKQVLPITLVPGNVAPRYSTEVAHVRIERVAITEEGTTSRLPIVDLELVGHDGKRYFTCLTGRHACAIAAAVRGVNARIHGIEEP